MLVAVCMCVCGTDKIIFEYTETESTKNDRGRSDEHEVKRPFSLKTYHRATAITVPTAQWIRSRWFFTTTHTVKNISATCKCP